MRKLLSLLTAALILSFSTFNAALAEQKIAIVDITAVVKNSTQVQALKKEQTAKMKELEKWLQNAKTNVEKQPTKEAKEKMLNKYNDEFKKKKETVTANYQNKLNAIDKSISESIAQQAKLKGYDMVITKGMVLYGGDDITLDVQNALNKQSTAASSKTTAKKRR